MRSAIALLLATISLRDIRSNGPPGWKEKILSTVIKWTFFRLQDCKITILNVCCINLNKPAEGPKITAADVAVSQLFSKIVIPHWIIVLTNTDLFYNFPDETTFKFFVLVLFFFAYCLLQMSLWAGFHVVKPQAKMMKHPIRHLESCFTSLLLVCTDNVTDWLGNITANILFSAQSKRSFTAE